MTQFIQPGLLLSGEQHVQINRVRCPVHGFIKYSEAERSIIDHVSFQRLRNIKQLGFTHYVYPGATHTRFEHSLGVMEVVSRVFNVICMKEGSVLIREIRKIDELRDNTLAKSMQALRLSALLHDVGHPPFSHGVEHLLEDHEEVSRRIIKKKFRPELDKRFFKGCYRLVSDILCSDETMEKMKRRDNVRWGVIQILHKFITGQIDLDRADYLLRDAHHCGVDYGRFDAARMIESLTLVKNKYTNLWEIGIDEGGYHTVENLLLARYMMNLQVYYHRIRRIYDRYLEEFVKANIGREQMKTKEEFQSLDDDEAVVLIKKEAKKKRSRAGKWARRIIERNHHREVFATSEHADAVEVQKVERIFEEVKKKYTRWDLILDKPKPGKVHNFWVPGENESSDDLLVKNRNNTVDSIGNKSEIIKKIPKTFRICRIFASPKNGKITGQNRRTLEKIKSFLADVS